MKDILAIFSSSAINKYGICMGHSTLESALQQGWKIGTPSFLSHDYHRPVGWSRPLALYFEPNLTQLVGVTQQIESSDEFDIIHQRLQMFFLDNIKKHVEPYAAELRGRLGLETKEGELCIPSCAAIIQEGIVPKIFPQLFSQKDKDGLISIKLLNEISPGVYEIDGLLVFAHQFFRRSLSRLNTLNEPFLCMLKRFKDSDLDIRVALDEDMIGLADTLQKSFEFEYWWGPKFKNDLNYNENAVTRYDADKRHLLFHGISRSEFRWSTQDGKKTFECEEIKDIPSFGVGLDSFGCRYIHSMIDSIDGNSVHIDGAVRLYDDEKMISRIDLDLAHAPKDTKYTKLWRIDGAVTTDKWKELITHYYRDNHLIGEYLGGIDDNASYPQLVEKETNPLYKYIPSNLDKGNGIRVALSYDLVPENATSIRRFVVNDYIVKDSMRYKYVESDVIEIIKILRKNNKKIVIPLDIHWVAFEDLVLNLPTIAHYGSESYQHTIETLDVIKLFCDQLVEIGDNRLISYTISSQYEDTMVNISVAGHVVDVCDWLKNSLSIPPKDFDDFGDWSEKVSHYLNKVISDNERPKLQDLLNSSGCLCFERIFIDPDYYKLYFANGSIRMSHQISREETELIKLLRSGKINYANANMIRRSRCSNCGKNYMGCNCSKYFQKGDVVQNVEKFDLLGVFWTNRKA